MPNTTWNDLQANEYGFYANVNPDVHHPRWRQDMERRLPQTLFSRQYIITRLFNGYVDQVASLFGYGSGGKLLSLANPSVWPMNRWLKPAVFLLALVPLALMTLQILQNNLGPDPAQELAKMTGEWTIRFVGARATPLRH